MRTSAQRTVYLHLSEPDDVNFEDFRVIGKFLSEQNCRGIEFDYDTQEIEFDNLAS